MNLLKKISNLLFSEGSSEHHTKSKKKISSKKAKAIALNKEMEKK